jgi:hypothetical protein
VEPPPVWFENVLLMTARMALNKLTSIMACTATVRINAFAEKGGRRDSLYLSLNELRN